jgi:rare lipoprotein A
MRGALNRIGMVLAALAAVAPATAVAQEPSGGATAPEAAPPSPFALSDGGSALLGHKVRFRGAVEQRLAGRTVVVQYLDPVTQAWTQQAQTTVKPDGSFLARWRARHTGQFQLRSVVGGAAQSSSVSPQLALTVYRPAVATWFGPGFYGHTTACGIELTPDLVGVAHRSLPCGTNVAIHYGSRTIVVPVVDRGPYGSKARWDLTEAAAQQLGFTQTDRIGAVRVSG